MIVAVNDFIVLKIVWMYKNRKIVSIFINVKKGKQ